MRDDKLVVENIRSGTCAAPNAAVELGNVLVRPTPPAGQPVGSIVDKVTVHPYHGDGQALQVNVPNPAPGEFGWTIDGYNGLVDLGTAQERNGDLLRGHRQDQPDPRVGQPPLARPVVDLGQRGRLPGRRQDVLRLLPRLDPVRARRRRGRRGRRPGGLSAYDDQGKGLSVSRGLGSAEQGHPRGGAKLGADLDLKIPDSVAKGSYRATLTITALSS